MTNTDEARRIYNDSVVIDSLNVSNWDSPAVFQSLSSGGATAINATIATWENFQETLAHIAGWGERFEQYRGTLLQVRTVDDIARAKREELVGVILGFQNASPIENDLARLAIFKQLGVGVIQVTYHERNLLGNGCFERTDEGLSNFGLDAVIEMNRVGILIDLSHVGERTTLETIEHSVKPVSCTHANAKSYYDVPRNKADEALKLLAEKGGVVGATAITTFLRTGISSTLEDYVDAIDYMVELIGIDHVGIGTDFTQDQPKPFWRYINSQQGTKFPSTFIDPEVQFDEMQLYPLGLETPDEMPNVAEALLRRGYGPDDVAKILGGNWLRLFREVW